MALSVKGVAVGQETQWKIALLTGGFTLLGALIGFLGAIVVAWWQTKQAKELAKYNDSLERRREFDREERQRKWEIERAEAARRHKPLLRVTFERASGKCVYPHRYDISPGVFYPQEPVPSRSSKRTDWYVNVLVGNEGGSPANNCKGRLTRLHKREGRDWKEQTIHGPHELIWAFDKQDVNLEVGTDMPLNVLIASKPTEPFKIQVKGQPELLLQSCAAVGEYLFTILVSADNADPQEIRIGLKWDGSWHGHWTEDVIWVEAPQQLASTKTTNKRETTTDK